MSELYKEALAETKKIKELAEADAKRKIIEEVSPFIKQMIVKETAFFFEEEEPAPSMEVSSEATPIVPTGATATSPDSEIEVVEAEKSVGTSDPLGIMSKTLKDLVGEEGKIAIDSTGKITIEPATVSVVDVADTETTEEPTSEIGAGSPAPQELAPPPASASEPAAPTPAAPAPMAPVAGPVEPAPEQPAAPVPLAENYRAFQINLGETALKIDEMYFSKKPSKLLAESLKNKLFGLLENLDYLNESGKINKTQFVLNEKKLEFLFEKLKEAKTGNSYNVKGNKDMGSLKEFASKLFEGEEKSLAHDAASSGKTGVAVHSAASAHAKKVSGVAPGVDLFDNEETVEALEGEALPGSGDAEDPDGWENAEPGALEETLELNEAELLEAVRALREGKGKEKKVVKENYDELEEGVTISLGLPDDLDLDASDITLSVEEEEDMEDMEDSEEEDMESDEEDMEDMESDEEGEIELELDAEEGEEEEEEEEEEGEEEEEEEMEEEGASMLYGEKGMEEALMESVLRSRNGKRAKLLESKLHQTVKAASKVKKLAESRNRELATMKSEMAETNLFLSKVLLLNKFLQREDLSQKQKQVIVEHLDRAQTIAEAKEIYVKIKNKLNEAAERGTLRTGSASAPVSSGAASFKVISESANKANDIVLGTPERWALLVKGRKDD
jgi:hypothetical protein